MPNVSVVLATHNRAHYIREAIDSVLAQTYRDFEIIIVDDGSTDNTRTVLALYSDKIRYFYQEHKNQATALNLGISKAQGQYIAFLDDDDVWLPEKLKVQVEFLDKNPDIGIVGSEMQIMNESGEVYSYWKPDSGIPQDFSGLYEYNLLGFPSVIARKQCLEKVNGLDESLSTTQDYDLWLRMAKHYRFRCLDAPLVKWRLHATNKHKNKAQKLRDRVKVISKPEISGHIGFLKKRIRIAREHYIHAQYFQDVRDFLSAAVNYLKAIFLYPLVGTYTVPQNAGTLGKLVVYRAVRAYLKAFYCLWMAFDTKVNWRRAAITSFLIIQFFMIVQARFVPERYFCWAPHDMQTAYELSVVINGKVLTEEEIQRKLGLPRIGYDPRAAANIQSRIRHYALTYGKNDETKVTMVYTVNGNPREPWIWYHTPENI